MDQTLLPLFTTTPGGLVVGRLLGVREVVGSIPGQFIPKTLKMVLDTSLLSTRHLKNRSRTQGRFPHCQLHFEAHTRVHSERITMLFYCYACKRNKKDKTIHCFWLLGSILSTDVLS